MALPLRYNFRSLLRRKTRAAMTALGIGLAVLVSVLMLALSTGLMNSIRATGNPLNVLVTSKGAETIEFSAIDLRVLDVLRFSPYVALKDGQPLASPELYFTTQVEIAPGVPSAPALVRGVLPLALGVNDQVRVTTGRFPNQPGEIMVGALVADQSWCFPRASSHRPVARFRGNTVENRGAIHCAGDRIRVRNMGTA